MEGADRLERPYDAEPTKTGDEVWAGSMRADQVERLIPKTGEIVEYLLPHATDIRRVFVQETGARLVPWVGNNHGAAFIRVEPLDRPQASGERGGSFDSRYDLVVVCHEM
jgi:streptogramin lyase